MGSRSSLGSGDSLALHLQDPSPVLPSPWYQSLLSIDSFLGAFLTLFGGTVGSGMLALPYAFQASGWPLAVSTLFLAVVLNLFTSYLLIRVSEQQSSSTMDMLSHHIFQSAVSSKLTTGLRVAAQVTVFLFNYGTLISYLIAVSARQSGNAVTKDFKKNGHEFSSLSAVCMFVAAALAFPLCLVNNIASLRYFAILSFLSPLYLAVFLMVSYDYDSHCPAQPCLQGQMISIPIILIATSCQDNIGDIYQDLRNKKRNGPLVLIAMLVSAFFVFLAVGQLGCMQFSKVNGNVLQDSRFPLHNAAGHLALFSMALALVCNIPFLVYPALRVLYPLLWRQNYRDSSLRKKAMMVGGTVFSAACLGIWLEDNFLLVMGAIGILSCVYISGALPCMLYLKGAPLDDPKWLKHISAAVLMLMVVIGLMSFAFLIKLADDKAPYCSSTSYI